MKEYIVQAFDTQNPIKLHPFYAEDVPELVRCKDCIRRGNPRECIVAKFAEQTGTPYFVVDNRGEWFCADGKRNG